MFVAVVVTNSGGGVTGIFTCQVAKDIAPPKPVLSLPVLRGIALALKASIEVSTRPVARCAAD